MRQKIGLDFDDVLFDFNTGLMEFHNATYGTSYTLQDITRWDFKELWRCDYNESLRRMQEFVTSPYHEITSPIEGAVDAVRWLQIKYDTPIITARDKKLDTETRIITDFHFPNHLEEIHYLHENGVNVLGTKGDVCRRLGVSIMVEDSIGNAETLSHAGVTTLLFDRPWNQATTLPRDVFRVFGWKHAIKEIRERLS